MRKQKIAIIYDWFDKWGGVERILLCLYDLFPDAVFYTSSYYQKKADWASSFKIKTSFINGFPDFVKHKRLSAMVFYPFAFESFDLGYYDIVISITSSYAKGVITKPKTKHICYLLTPTRYLWVDDKSYIKKEIFRKIVNPYTRYLKSWDLIAAQRPDVYISISDTVAKRCRKFYHKESEVIYPPFDYLYLYWDKISTDIGYGGLDHRIHTKKFFLLVSRLESYKKVDTAIKVFNKLGSNLVIVGTGSQAYSFKRSANKNIIFLDKVCDSQLAWLYNKAQALIMPQEEDFGYVSLESQYFGCPVIAYGKGGASETVIDRQTGLLYTDQSEKSLIDAVARHHTLSYNIKDRIQTVKRNIIIKYSKDRFYREFLAVVKNIV